MTAPKLLTNFSAGTCVGRTLFVAADEHATINRLVRRDREWVEADAHALADLLPLQWPDEEADIEGLAANDGWLWVIGSHARTRAKPEQADGESIDLKRLAALKDTRPRCLVARIPLVREGGSWTPVRKNGKRRAGVLTQTKHGNVLSKAMRQDPLLGPFMRIPAKEGGVDIEGVAASGTRVALGMRGPVISGHALLLEIELDPRPSGKLRLAGHLSKRLLALDGLGIRDLKRLGNDLLILAGPTTALSGPCALYRWRKWVDDPPLDAAEVRLHRPERLFDLPFGTGFDHPEGLALIPGRFGKEQVMVIYDRPGAGRIDLHEGTFIADLFGLPS